MILMWVCSLFFSHSLFNSKNYKQYFRFPDAKMKKICYTITLNLSQKQIVFIALYAILFCSTIIESSFCTNIVHVISEAGLFKNSNNKVTRFEIPLPKTNPLSSVLSTQKLFCYGVDNRNSTFSPGACHLPDAGYRVSYR